jgi:O-acetyl-ADP-ribose deacetylase (regulator of RNase III)
MRGMRHGQVKDQVQARVEDITDLEVDAIVNAANENMDHIGGLAKVIVVKGS